MLLRCSYQPSRKVEPLSSINRSKGRPYRWTPTKSLTPRVGDKRKMQRMAQEPASSPTPTSTIVKPETSAHIPQSAVLTVPPRQKGETEAQWKTRRNRERKQMERSRKERAATEDIVEVEAKPSASQRTSKPARKNARAPKEGSVKPGARKPAAAKKKAKKDAKPRDPFWENDRGNNGPDGLTSLDHLAGWMGEEGVISTFKISDLSARRAMSQPFIKAHDRQGFFLRDADAVITKVCSDSVARLWWPKMLTRIPSAVQGCLSALQQSRG
jgi:hypothetical protein